MTAHRGHGATLPGRVILHVRGAFAPAIVYVMLSRATQRSNVRILGALQPGDFTPVSEAGIPAWEARQRGSDDDAGGSSSSSDNDGAADLLA